MKRIVLLSVVTLLWACGNDQSSYLDSFNSFIDGLQRRDIKLISDFSTETTSAMISKIISSGKVTYILVYDGNIGKVVSGKSMMQHKVVIIRDFVSADSKNARVWFKLNDSADIYTMNLVYRRGRWLVDIPLESFILY